MLGTGEKVFFATLIGLWLMNLGFLCAYEPEQMILFGRIFVAVCTGIARMCGIA